MIKLSDYIANYLAAAGVRHIFMVTGGAAMHLNDSFGKHKDLTIVVNHHEQATAMAAESYARLTNKVGVINVTAGPGGINALNGVFGAWTDSIPMLIISGQVRYDSMVKSTGLPLRQMGDQECDIVGMVSGITKYAVVIANAQEIKFHLQKALYFATQGRPGPVWLDIPMNIQGAYIDEASLTEYHFPREETQQPATISADLIAITLSKIQQAERPIILAGTGIRLGGAEQAFLKLVEQLKIPVTTAFNAHDLIAGDNPYYVGRPGTIGDRAGNFAVQNSDLIIVLGCRLNIRQMGYHWESFARAAYKIWVDIDAAELQKPSFKADLPMHGDVGDFIEQLLVAVEESPLTPKNTWLDWCKQRQKKYPVVLDSYWERRDTVNPYCFMQTLGEQLPEQQIIVTADATACITAFQAMQMKPLQRLYSNSGCASMGYELPAAIGACVGSGGKKIVCLAGDGSIQMNLQELATISGMQLPIKIFWLNNQGYHSIRQTQENYFGKPLVGVDLESGLFLPSAEKIAHAYGLQYFACQNHATMKAAMLAALADDKPAICEVILTIEQAFAPKMSSQKLPDGRMVSKPLEDLAPFLSREELMENMLIELLPEV